MTDLQPLSISDQRQALETAALWAKQDTVILDTETTGLGSDARLVSIAIVDLAGNVLFNEILNPGIPNPPDAMEINHITNERLAEARSVQEAWPEIVEILSGRWMILSYNANFDARIMRQTATALSLDFPAVSWDCIMEAFAIYNGEWDDRHNHFRWIKLSQAAKDLSIPTPVVHNALADAQLARRVVLRMAGRFEDLQNGAKVSESLDSGVKLLALYHRRAADAKADQNTMLEKLKRSRKWQWLEMERLETEEFISKLETHLRTEAAAYFERTGYRDPHQAIEVKNMSKLIYDASKAIDWAIDKFRAAVSLDKKLFEKYARSLMGVDPVPFVDIEYTPQAQLSTDLSAYLPKSYPEHVQIDLKKIDEIAF